nr:hypothetical protein CFP56_16225 [Quercus suber]
MSLLSHAPEGMREASRCCYPECAEGLFCFALTARLVARDHESDAAALMTQQFHLQCTNNAGPFFLRVSARQKRTGVDDNDHHR